MAALRTWQFPTIRLDGLEEEALLQDAFNAWRPQLPEKSESSQSSEISKQHFFHVTSKGCIELEKYFSNKQISDQPVVLGRTLARRQIHVANSFVVHAV